MYSTKYVSGGIERRISATRGGLDPQGRHDRRTAGYNQVILEGIECGHHWRMLREYNRSRTLQQPPQRTLLQDCRMMSNLTTTVARRRGRGNVSRVCVTSGKPLMGGRVRPKPLRGQGSRNHRTQQQEHQHLGKGLHAYDPVIFKRSSSGSRSRISAGRRSCTWRAPSMATSTTAMGAGVATATISQINADSAKPTSAAISSQKALRGPKWRITPNASRNTPAETDARVINAMSMVRCRRCRLRQCSQAAKCSS